MDDIQGLQYPNVDHTAVVVPSATRTREKIKANTMPIVAHHQTPHFKSKLLVPYHTLSSGKPASTRTDDAIGLEEE